MVAVAGAVHCTAATALVINEFCVCAKGPLSSSRLMLLPSGGDLLFPKIARFMSIFLGDRTLTLGGEKLSSCAAWTNLDSELPPGGGYARTETLSSIACAQAEMLPSIHV
jgi:hypothetical protein